MNPATENQIFNLTLQEEEEACIHAMQLASASAFPMVLKAAIELDVFEIIAEAAHHGDPYLTPSEIASKLSSTTNTQSPLMLDRMLRLLASYNVLSCKVHTLDGGGVERLYGLAPVCKFLLKNKDGASMAPMLLMHTDKVFMESWYHLNDAVLDGGIPFNKAHGMEEFEYNATDPRFSKIFNKAMSGHSRIIMKKLLDLYKGFDGLESMVDVGGGFGATINMIVSKYPSISAINFDLPHVIAVAPTYPGVEHIGGDMFVSIPKADVIFMKSILHDWSDEHCLKILKNSYKALPSDGKMIILESILPEFPESSVRARRTFQLDNVMLAHHRGGKERTEKEFEELSNEAGFAGFKVVCCAFNSWVMELCKNK